MWNRSWILLLILLAGAGCANPERGDRVRGLLVDCPWLRTRECPPLPCCPDDYVCKPQPRICPVRYCGECDDYCVKPMPCIANICRCGSCDDYCAKSLPCLLCPPLTPYLQCGPPEEHCAACGKCKRGVPWGHQLWR